jgi:hypothetical protein
LKFAAPFLFFAINKFMDALQLKQAQWKQKKKTAELSVNGKVFLTIDFSKKKTKVVFGNRRLDIKTKGFWHPQVLITEGEKILLTQKHIGFWGSKNQVQTEKGLYEGKTQSSTLYNLTYFTQFGQQVVSYRLNTLDSKAVVNFFINETIAISFDDLLLLFILGFYTIRAVAEENTLLTIIAAAT